ncbi:MAG: serine protease [Gallionellaceae bacterium]
MHTLSKIRDYFHGGFFSAANGVLLLCGACLFACQLWGDELPHTVARVKPAIVGIATFKKIRNPPINFMATGFAVGDGLNVITNAHVIPEETDIENKESLGIIIGKGEATEFRTAVLVAIDKEHDLALLKISGVPLPVMELGDSDTVQEGQSLAFTGFPIGMVLGFHPVTHRGMISSITPVVMPALNAAKLSVRVITQLQKSAFSVFQLDGTAYPGNSGSPLYDPETGAVYGVINMVFVKGLKEAALSQPSGITYAIPSKYVRELLQRTQPSEKNRQDQLLGP